MKREFKKKVGLCVCQCLKIQLHNSLENFADRLLDSRPGIVWCEGLREPVDYVMLVPPPLFSSLMTGSGGEVCPDYLGLRESWEEMDLTYR